jgi:PTS system nitrogen regulatory IIA component
VIPSLVIFELLGAWLSERTLRKWREWTVGEQEAFREPECGEHEFSLSALLGDRVVEITAATKDEAIFQLARACVTLSIASDMETIRTLIEEREQLGSTGIGDGIALPHCRTDLVERTLIICGIMQKPLPWGAPDLQPVELVFLIVNPDRYPEQHLQAIRMVSMALQQTDFKHGIRRAFFQNDLQKYLKRVSNILQNS